MKKNISIWRIIVLAVVLVLCFSTIAVSQDTTIMRGGKGSSADIGSASGSFEVNVGETTLAMEPDPYLKEHSLAAIDVTINAGIDNPEAYEKIRFYLKITDPNGKVILDINAYSANGPAKHNDRFYLTEILTGKYTVWYKRADIDDILTVVCTISGFPKQ